MTATTETPTERAAFYFRILGGPMFPTSERVTNISIKVQRVGAVEIAVVFVGDDALCATPLRELIGWVLNGK